MSRYLNLHPSKIHDNEKSVGLSELQTREVEQSLKEFLEYFSSSGKSPSRGIASTKLRLHIRARRVCGVRVIKNACHLQSRRSCKIQTSRICRIIPWKPIERCCRTRCNHRKRGLHPGIDQRRHVQLPRRDSRTFLPKRPGR